MNAAPAVKWRAAADLVVITATVASYLWWWRAAFSRDKIVLAAALVGWSIYIQWSRHERFSKVIGSRATFIAALRIVCLWAAVPLLAILLAALFCARDPLPPLTELAARLAMFVLIGILQQYLLLAHLWRSAADLWPRLGLSQLVAAIIFALLHEPNAFLVLVTFAGALAACAIYKRAPNIFALGLGHGFLSFALYYGLPRAVTGGLRVGSMFAR
jgi:hypothetical protein